ncbi:glycosyltransferase family 4 protein [Caenispirillum salinarum]|uniref:glycosyltransferase family 4 protein n=1 Tax=Caenispirillum salinarum TaxID=859058 RepID=UPI00384EF657
MNVTFVMYGAWFAQGGMEKYNRRLIRALTELPGVKARAFSVLDNPHAPCPVPMRTGGGKTKAVRDAVLTHVLTNRPDVLILGHVDFLPIGAAARVTAPKCKVILLANGPEVWGDPSHRRTPGWEAFLSRKVPHRIAALSEVTLKRMSRRHHIPRDRFALLPQAVDTIHEDVKRPHGHNILTVARLGVRDVNKGVGLVIRALPRLLERFPALRYRIVGAGPLIEPLWDYAVQMGVHRRVEFLGPLDDAALDKVYRQTDLVVLPSKKEGSGLAFLEAWSHGIPVVGGTDDAAAWLIEDGVTGLTAPPGQVGSAIWRVLLDAKAAREMGRKGREQIPGAFDHESFRARLAALLEVPDTAAVAEGPAALPEMDEAQWEPVSWEDTPADDVEAEPWPAAGTDAGAEAWADPVPPQEPDPWAPAPDPTQTYEQAEPRPTLGDALGEMMPDDVRRQWEEEGFTLPDNGTDPSDAWRPQEPGAPGDGDDWSRS